MASAALSSRQDPVWPTTEITVILNKLRQVQVTIQLLVKSLAIVTIILELHLVEIIIKVLIVRGPNQHQWVRPIMLARGQVVMSQITTTVTARTMELLKTTMTPRHTAISASEMPMRTKRPRSPRSWSLARIVVDPAIRHAWTLHLILYHQSRSINGNVLNANLAGFVGHQIMMISSCFVTTVIEVITCTAWTHPLTSLQRDLGAVVYAWKNIIVPKKISRLN